MGHFFISCDQLLFTRNKMKAMTLIVDLYFSAVLDWNLFNRSHKFFMNRASRGCLRKGLWYRPDLTQLQLRENFIILKLQRFPRVGELNQNFFCMILGIQWGRGCASLVGAVHRSTSPALRNISYSKDRGHLLATDLSFSLVIVKVF